MEEQELRDLGRRTRKLLTMNRRFHPQDCVAWLYLPRKDRGRGLISVEDCVNQVKTLLQCYVQSREEELLKAARRENLRMEKQLPALKQGEEPKIFKIGKKSHYMDSLHYRVQNREVRKHGLG